MCYDSRGVVMVGCDGVTVVVEVLLVVVTLVVPNGSTAVTTTVTTRTVTPLPSKGPVLAQAHPPPATPRPAPPPIHPPSNPPTLPVLLILDTYLSSNSTLTSLCDRITNEGKG